MVNSLTSLLICTLAVSGTNTFAAPLRRTENVAAHNEELIVRDLDEPNLLPRAKAPPVPHKPAHLKGNPVTKAGPAKQHGSKAANVMKYLVPGLALLPAGYLATNAIIQASNDQTITRRDQFDEPQLVARKKLRKAKKPKKPSPVPRPAKKTPPPVPAKPEKLKGEPVKKPERTQFGDTKMGEITRDFIIPAVGAIIPTVWLITKAVIQVSTGQKLSRRSELVEQQLFVRVKLRKPRPAAKPPAKKIPPPVPAKPEALKAAPVKPEHKKHGDRKVGEVVKGLALPLAASVLPTAFMGSKALYQHLNGQNITRRAEHEDSDVFIRALDEIHTRSIETWAQLLDRDEDGVSPRETELIMEHTLRMVAEMAVLSRNLYELQETRELESLD